MFCVGLLRLCYCRLDLNPKAENAKDFSADWT